MRRSAFTTARSRAGRAIVPDSRGRIRHYLAGWGILRAVAFIPVFGALAWLAATIFGLGLLTVALWRSRGPVVSRPETGPSAP